MLLARGALESVQHNPFILQMRTPRSRKPGTCSRSAGNGTALVSQARALPSARTLEYPHCSKRLGPSVWGALDGDQQTGEGPRGFWSWTDPGVKPGLRAH